MKKKEFRPSIQSKKPLTTSEREEVESFCSAYSYPEIDFEDWKNSNSSLNLVVPVFIEPEQIGIKQNLEIHFIRTVNTENRGRKIVKKEKASATVYVPEGSKEGALIKVDAVGDILGNSVGTVQALLKTKRKR